MHAVKVTSFGEEFWQMLGCVTLAQSRQRAAPAPQIPADALQLTFAPTRSIHHWIFSVIFIECNINGIRAFWVWLLLSSIIDFRFTLHWGISPVVASFVFTIYFEWIFHTDLIIPNGRTLWDVSRLGQLQIKVMWIFTYIELCVWVCVWTET